MVKTIRLSGIVGDSIVDGAGIRMTVFTQGCPHHCEGCHNPQTHDFAGGYDESVDSVLEKFQGNPLQCGITLSGGEPFCQAEPLIELCKGVRALGKSVWAYPGYTFEELLSGSAPPYARELLELCDVLVDGTFELAQRDLTLTFRGSRNQRVIDVRSSLTRGEAVLYPVADENG